MIIRQRLNQGRFPVVEKTTEPKVVVFVKFTSVSAAPHQLWKLRDWIASRALHPAGPPACLFQFQLEQSAEPVESIAGEAQWEIAEEPRAGAEEVEVKWVAPIRVVSTYHLGDTATIGQTLQFLEQTIGESGYQVAGPVCERYLFDISAPKSRWITEVQVPIV